MNNFLDFENEYLKIKIDTLFGGKIVEIVDKKKMLIGFGLILINILNSNPYNFLIMTLNG